MMADSLSNAKDVIQNSSIINTKESLNPSAFINEQYNNIIDERIYSYKNFSLNNLRQQGFDEDSIKATEVLDVKNYSKMIKESLLESLDELIPESQKRLMKMAGGSSSYSGIYFAEKVHDKSNVLADMISEMPFKTDAIVLKKNDALFLFAHGTEQGNIFFHRREYSPEKFVDALHKKNLIPDDIKKLYTINCYGGKQQSFISSGGIDVKSAHTSTNPILGMAMFDKNSPLFSIALNNGDIIDEVKKISMEDGQLSVLYSPKELNQVLLKKRENNSGETAKPSTSKKNHKENSLPPKENELLTKKALKEKIPQLKNKAETFKSKSLQTKSLGGRGKLAIGVAIAGAVGAGAAIKKNNKPKDKERQTSTQRESYGINNDYAMQVAQDVSTYRYGKHMTGFINP